MKQLILTFLLIFSFSAQSIYAQDLSAEKRDKYVKEIRKYEHEFFAKELGLSKKQQSDFFPVYDEMEDALMKVRGEVRKLEKKALSSSDVSDLEYETAARAIFDQKQREYEIEMKYFDKMKAVLTPKQLVQLKTVERQFMDILMRMHHDKNK